MLNNFLSGCLFLGFLVASLFFFKFWRTAKDGLFLMFALAFALFGIERLLFTLFGEGNETQPYAYIIRLAAFCLIIAAIVGKNRR
jgi:hypothetical protein